MSRDILVRPAPPADLRLRYGPHESQFGDLRLPAGSGPHPLLIVIHGGYWRARYDLTYAGHLSAALTAAGHATWNIEYRRIGNGGGWPETFLDVAAAADHVRVLAERFPLDLTRLAAIGHSAGGHLALWLAGRHRLPPDSRLASDDPLPLRAAIGLAAVSDLRLAWEWRLSDNVVSELLGGSPAEVSNRYAEASPAALLPLGIPQVLMHGTADDSVPHTMSVAYHDAAVAAGDPVSLITLAGSGHFELVDPESAVWPSVRNAVDAACMV